MIFAGRRKDGGPAAPAATVPDTCRALDRVAAIAPLQGLLGVALAVSAGTLAAYLRAQSWLGLFGAVLLPMAIATAMLNVERGLQRRKPSWLRLWIVLALSLAASAWVVQAAYPHWMTSHQVRGLGTPQVVAAALGLAVLMIAAPLWRSQHEARTLHLAALRQAALAAELKALQAQVEPHFLYNTLANTRYLAGHDPARAVQMLDHLIGYLHSVLPNMRSRMSTVGCEFDMARHYLALMSIRFGDRVHYELHCAPEAVDAAMPPLMLMTLVENAVKHGVEPQPGNVRVDLFATAEHGRLRLLVRDTGPGVRTGVAAGGVGLRNLRERCAALYDGRASFSLRSLDGGGAEAELILPLETTA